MRRQITEVRLLSRFKKLFGGPETTVIAIGDFEQRKHRKFKEPIKGKGLAAASARSGCVPTVSNRQCPATRPREL